MSLSLWRCTAE